MKITIIGAGAAGLSSAILIKQRLPDAAIRMLESAAEGETPGLGIALLPFGLNEIRMMNLPGFDDFASELMPIDLVTEAFAEEFGGGERATQTRTQETQYWGLRRAVLVRFLRSAAVDAGIDIVYGSDVDGETLMSERSSADLLIGADGAGSVVRQAYVESFDPVAEAATSRYAWLEVDGDLDRFVFGYVRLEDGLVRVTAYPHSRGRGSAIITHSAELTAYFDADDMIDADGNMSAKAIDVLNEAFSGGLGGRTVEGQSRWRTFRATHCRSPAFENVALVGDAFATVFYETGWGTSAALQESRILAQALLRRPAIAEALDLYGRKSVEIANGLVEGTSKAMRDVDGQSVKLNALGPRAFLDTYPA